MIAPELHALAAPAQGLAQARPLIGGDHEGKRQRGDSGLDGVGPRRARALVEPRNLTLEVAAAELRVVLELLGHREGALAQHRPALVAQEIAQLASQRGGGALGARAEVGTGEQHRSSAADIPQEIFPVSLSQGGRQYRP